MKVGVRYCCGDGFPVLVKSEADRLLGKLTIFTLPESEYCFVSVFMGELLFCPADMMRTGGDGPILVGAYSSL